MRRSRANRNKSTRPSGGSRQVPSRQMRNPYAPMELINESQLEDAMNKYITDDKLIKEHRVNAKHAFEKFNVEKCAENYLEIFS